MAYKKKGFLPTGLRGRNQMTGQTIEQKVYKAVHNKESMKGDGAPLIYTERKDGVAPGYDIRTDRFEVALEAINTVQRSQTARRAAKMEVVKPEANDQNDGRAESTTGTK